MLEFCMEGTWVMGQAVSEFGSELQPPWAPNGGGQVDRVCTSTGLAQGLHP
jgi:hypothetical protein